jgi:hypothetical protein
MDESIDDNNQNEASVSSVSKTSSQSRTPSQLTLPASDNR